jgi:hypothetical protein
MKLVEQRARLYLSEDGQRFLQSTSDVPLIEPLPVEVVETEEIGIWIRMWWGRAPECVLLIRWEFVLGVELESEKTKTVGLRGWKDA